MKIINEENKQFFRCEETEDGFNFEANMNLESLAYVVSRMFIMLEKKSGMSQEEWASSIVKTNRDINKK